MTASSHRARRVAIALTLASTSGVFFSPAMGASGAQVLSPTNTLIRSACARSSPVSRVGVPATAQLQAVRTNLLGNPRGLTLGPDLALFSKSATLYDCLTIANHVSGPTTNDGVKSYVTHLTGTNRMAGIAGILKGGYTNLRDRNTVTLWATGVVAPSVTGVTLSIDYSITCPNNLVCPGALLSAGSTSAVMHGHYFVASMVVAYSAARVTFNVILQRHLASGVANTTTDAGNFSAPTTSRPVFSTFNETN